MIEVDGLIKIDDMNQFNSDDLDTLLHKILNYLKQITSCEAGTIYLKDDDNNLRFTIFQNDIFSYETIFKLQEPLKNLKFPIKQNSNTIAVESYLQSKIITVDDIYNSTDFNFESSKKFDEQFNYKTKSILTAPLINFFNTNCIGVLQLINKKDQNENYVTFTDNDKEFISLSSYLITLSINSTKDKISELEMLNKELENKVKIRTKKLQETQKKLMEQANRDPLTNLYNRRYFNEIIINLMQLSKRSKSDLSIMMIDIDDFKKVNDTYGHSVGDIVINKLADIFRKNTRTSDIIIRFGGEEFVIILPSTSTKYSKSICEKLRKAVENNTISLEKNQEIKFTISIGLSLVGLDDNSIDIALHKADEALYKSKQNGKNQTNVVL